MNMKSETYFFKDDDEDDDSSDNGGRVRDNDTTWEDRSEEIDITK